MTNHDVLSSAKTIALVDWPTREVPESLARAGLAVVSHDGPADDEWNAYEVDRDEVVARPVGAPPEEADVVYTHRPLNELESIVELARRVGAKAVWCQTGSQDAQRIVEAAGLHYVNDPIVEAARQLSG